MTDATEIDMDEVVDELRRRGIHAYVEQTGGGCATIYAGPQHDDGEQTRWACVAGPGAFAGEGWTRPRGILEDFYVGADDDGESEVWGAGQEDTPETIAARIESEVRKWQQAGLVGTAPRPGAPTREVLLHLNVEVEEELEDGDAVNRAVGLALEAAARGRAAFEALVALADPT